MGVNVRRARIEEIRGLAEEFRAESTARSADGRPWDPPIPQGGIFWRADGDDGEALGYAAGTLRPSGMTVGPVFVRGDVRRRGVGAELISGIQQWAVSTRVPVLEISVAADNEAGQAFLRSLGYRPRRILMSVASATRPDDPARDELADL